MSVGDGIALKFGAPWGRSVGCRGCFDTSGTNRKRVVVAALTRVMQLGFPDWLMTLV